MRMFIFLGGVLMAASWGLTWIEPPFAGADLSPMALARDGRLSLGMAGPWQSWVFLGGFAAAAVAALLALGGGRARVLALMAGLSPLVLLGDALIRGAQIAQQTGLPAPVDFADPAGSWALMENFLRPGFWVYLGGCAILLIAGVARSVKRR